MDQLCYRRNRIVPYVVTAGALALLLAGMRMSDSAGWAVPLLATLSVISGTWYFGIGGGVVMVILTSLATLLVQGLIFDSGRIIGTLALIGIALIVASIRTMTHDWKRAADRLRDVERERQAHFAFLQAIFEITQAALEAGELRSTLKIILERVAPLFLADAAFFDYWDADEQLTTPAASYGSLSESYPGMRFAPGESTVTALAIQTGKPVVVEDLHVSGTSIAGASRYPNRAMLAIPLIVHGNGVAALLLGYNQTRRFEADELVKAEIAARQIALVLMKTQMLEEARRQLVQLSALHEVAVVSTQVETVDQLIERTTEIVSRSLFPDNFGVLLIDEETDVLRFHPSYRFGTSEPAIPAEVRLGEGITGHVADTGQPVRIGNVRLLDQYLDVEAKTTSELCVPIRLKSRVLGVINAESPRADAFSADDELLLDTLAGQLAIAIEQLQTAAAERRWLDQLARSNELVYALASITTHIERALSPAEITESLGRELLRIGLTCALAVYDDKRKSFRFGYTSLEPGYVEELERRLNVRLSRYTFSLDYDRPGPNLQKLYQAAVVSDPEEELRLIFGGGRRESFSPILEGIRYDMDVEAMRLPLMFEQHLMGILWIWGRDLNRADLPILSIFAKQIGVALERARLFQEVQNLAATDSLTGLQNRRSLFEVGRLEFARAQRLNHAFCCMMLDLDHFKQINDTYGHVIGDEVLREFAQRCKRSVREIDLIGRYGGEELMILLPDTELNTALQVAERLREAISEVPIHASYRELEVTVSIGVATRDENTTELETLIARADQAMYIAKYKGRNQVAVSR